jgi:photosystem II stability/assembly factor-like uncharacterized protein
MPRRFLLCLTFAATLAVAQVDPVFFQGLRYRNLGPARGGRVTAITGVRTQPLTFYMGATGGGVWKTTDAGITWTPITDGQIATGSIGALDVADSDPNVIYMGTGSAAIRSNVIHGRGLYKSTDAGKTWQFIGLRDAGQIGSIRVHPKDPNTVYVAALGQPFMDDAQRLSFPTSDRGVFRTKDGGKTWQKVLYVNDKIGAVSLALNRSNPNEIYAGMWQAERKPWTIISGGSAAQTGIYKTTDGGDTWQHLTNGLPADLIGKVDVDISQSKPSRVYAILEAPGNKAGVYRSDDSGATWAQVSSQASLIQRPFYYTYIDADPKDPEKVYVNNLGFYRSSDGGRTWQAIPTPHGDNHGVWINPDHPEIFIQSNDGGATVTQNGGRSWSTLYNQPTEEIYGLAVDNQFPYRIYGAQQDTSATQILPSLPPKAGRLDDPIQAWQSGPGCETGPIMPNPKDPDIVYGSCKGEFSRMNLRTGQEKNNWVHPQNRYGHAARDLKYRFQRVSPMEVSPHDSKTIYYGSQFVHRTRDEGVTWEVISPDLTANEPSKQGISGEPITRDITGEEMYSTLYAIRESALEPGVIWAGSNDGPLHVTRDNGKTWKNVTPKDLPPGGRVQNIEPSPRRKGSAYIAVYRYLLGDFRPYLYRTDNYGATWTLLTNGIPADSPVRVVREDPDREGLLYAGTEFGLYVSFDNGARWQPFQLNLPVTPVTDIRVHQKDLVISTMGRGFWILDDLSPLHQLAGITKETRMHLFAPRAAYRMSYPATGRRGSAAAPEYPQNGVRIDYYLASAQPELKLELLDAKGEVIRSYSARDAAQAPAQPNAEAAGEDPDRPQRGGGFSAPLPTAAGMHRYLWDLRHRGGPVAVPGTYTVRLSAGDQVLTQKATVKIDPRVAAEGVTQGDLEEQLSLHLKLRDAIADGRRLQQKIDQALRSPKDQAQTAKLQEIRTRLVTARGNYPQPMLIDQLSNTQRMISGADQKPGRSASEYYTELRRELDQMIAAVDQLTK